MPKACKVQIKDNVDAKTTRKQLFRTLKEFKGPYLMPVDEVKDGPIALVCSGPSAEETLPTLRDLYRDGVPVMAANGMHDWLIERGIVPTWHVMLDRRERMADFVRKSRSDVEYMIASHCHQAVFDVLEGKDLPWWKRAFRAKRKITSWHCHGSADELPMIEAALPKFAHIRGGCTVGMHMLVIGSMLGYTVEHLFGYDGCFVGDRHHATDDKWTKPKRRIMVGGRTYTVDGWMIGQAQDFQQIVDILSRDGVTMAIHGEGLLSWIATLKAQINPEGLRPGARPMIGMIDLDDDVAQPEAKAA